MFAVPYRSTPQSLVAVISNEVPITVGTALAVLAYT